MRTLVIIATIGATLALAPSAGAQTSPGSSERMQGPPNSNGYADRANAPSSESAQPDRGSSKLKGPPNANGMQRDDSRK